MAKARGDQHQLGLWSVEQPATAGRRPVKAPSPRRTDQRDLWDVDDVAAYLGVPKQTVYSWRCSGYGPQGFRVGKHVRWHPATVIAWTQELERRA